MTDSAITNCLYCGLRYSYCKCMDTMKTINVPVYLINEKQPSNKQIVQTAAGELRWNSEWGRFVNVTSGASAFGHFSWWSPRICDVLSDSSEIIPAD